jgi:hypothetical protein
MNKYLVLIFLFSFISSYSQNSEFLKFLDDEKLTNELYDFPAELAKGILDAFEIQGELNFPQIRHCIDNDEKLTVAFHKLIKDILHFKGDQKTISNFIRVVFDFSHLLMKIKTKYEVCFVSTKTEENFIISSLEQFLMNLAPNFKIYYKNFISNKNQIVDLLKEIEKNFKTDPYSSGRGIGQIISIVIKNAKYFDDSLESFEEFELFNNCYSNIILGPTIDYQAFNDLMRLIFKKEKIEDFLYSLSNMFAVMSDRISHCSKYFKHLNK